MQLMPPNTRSLIFVWSTRRASAFAPARAEVAESQICRAVWVNAGLGHRVIAGTTKIGDFPHFPLDGSMILHQIPPPVPQWRQR
jgi:hypothetical protein